MKLEPVEYSCDNVATKILLSLKTTGLLLSYISFEKSLEKPYMVTEFLIKNQRKHIIRP